MDKDLWISFLRLIDEGSEQELQSKREELLRSLEDLSIRRGPVRSDVMRVVRLIDAELLARRLRARRRARR